MLDDLLDLLLELLGLRKATALRLVSQYPDLFRVEVLDQRGRRMKRVKLGVWVTAFGASLGGALYELVTDGVAVFSTLTINPQGGTMAIRLTFSAPGLPPITSDPITLTPVATELRILAQPPATAQDGKPFPNTVVVGAFSSSGKPVPGVEISVAADNGGLIVGPNKATTDADGADFVGLGLNDPLI